MCPSEAELLDALEVRQSNESFDCAGVLAVVAEHKFRWIVRVVNRESKLMIEEVSRHLPYLLLRGEIVACESAEFFLCAQSEEGLDVAVMVE